MKKIKEIQGLILENYFIEVLKSMQFNSINPIKDSIYIIKEYSNVLESDLLNIDVNKIEYQTTFEKLFYNWIKAKQDVVSIALHPQKYNDYLPIIEAEKSLNTERAFFVTLDNYRVSYFKNSQLNNLPNTDLFTNRREFEFCLFLDEKIKFINDFCNNNEFLSLKELSKSLINKGVIPQLISLLVQDNGHFQFSYSTRVLNNDKILKFAESLFERKETSSYKMNDFINYPLFY